MPDDWVELASAAARAAGFVLTPDICLINFYQGDGRMGLHQDKDESAESIAAGLPVVSLSVGDAARFLVVYDVVNQSRRSFWNQEMHSCSAARPVSGITASRASCPARRRRYCDWTDAST